MGDVIPIVLPSPLCQQLARSLLITSTLWWSGWCGFIAVYFTVKVCLDLKGSNMPNRSSCVTLSRFSGGWCSKSHPYILYTSLGICTFPFFVFPFSSMEYEILLQVNIPRSLFLHTTALRPTSWPPLKCDQWAPVRHWSSIQRSWWGWWWGGGRR